MLDVSDRHNLYKPGKFGIRGVLSLDLLLDFWRREEQENNFGLHCTAAELNRQVEQLPELRGAISDPAVLKPHGTLVRTLLNAVFPPGLQSLACSAVCRPASWEFFQATPRFQRELLDEKNELKGHLLLDGITWEYLTALFSNLGVLRHCYGVPMRFDKSVLVQVENEENGLYQSYQLRGQFDMLRIEPVGELPPLNYELLEQVKERLTDLELWSQLIDQDNFRMYGMMVFHATDVTEEVTSSQLKEILVEPDALVKVDRFEVIEKLVRTLLRLPGIEMTVLGIEGETAFRMDGREGLKLNEQGEDLCSVVGSSCRSELFCGAEIIHADLQQVPQCSGLMADLRARGDRSYMMLPLKEDGKLLGTLVLTTPEPGQLSELTSLSLEGVRDLFSLALSRSLADVHNRAQAVLKEKFTPIHPCVEWKFRAAALQYLRTKELNDVVFPEVFSLYAASDIRSSSELRNQAIRSDLVRQIETAKGLLEKASGKRRIDYLGSLIFRLERLASELDLGVRSGDEMRIARILASEVEPVFDSLETFGEEIQDSIVRYRKDVCTQSGGLFRERRAYEDSVDKLAKRLTALLTEQQIRAQEVFPHLFQMYRTDGIEHTIYVGNSLTEREDFSMLYFKELRLWQLRSVCEHARVARQMESELSVPLQVAHLILAQSDSIGLRYSQEEKKFNVDGAYNIRYEIIKKRIDKACIKGTGERLTQPGQLAVVFTQPQEEHEYRHFFDYLQREGEIESGVELHDLEDLQGVYGLRALRVAVKL